MIDFIEDPYEKGITYKNNESINLGKGKRTASVIHFYLDARNSVDKVISVMQLMPVRKKYGVSVGSHAQIASSIVVWGESVPCAAQ